MEGTRKSGFLLSLLKSSDSACKELSKEICIHTVYGAVGLYVSGKLFCFSRH